MRALRATVRTAAHWGVQALTVFAFSTENWERPKVREREGGGWAEEGRKGMGVEVDGRGGQRRPGERRERRKGGEKVVT